MRWQVIVTPKNPETRTSYFTHNSIPRLWLCVWAHLLEYTWHAHFGRHYCSTTPGLRLTDCWASLELASAKLQQDELKNTSRAGAEVVIKCNKVRSDPGMQQGSGGLMFGSFVWVLNRGSKSPRGSYCTSRWNQRARRWAMLQFYPPLYPFLCLIVLCWAGNSEYDDATGFVLLQTEDTVRSRLRETLWAARKVILSSVSLAKLTVCTTLFM